jgi:hypothetical protein
MTQQQLIERLRGGDGAVREGKVLGLRDELAGELLEQFPNLSLEVAQSCAGALVRRLAVIALALDEVHSGAPIH